MRENNYEMRGVDYGNREKDYDDRRNNYGDREKDYDDREKDYDDREKKGQMLLLKQMPETFINLYFAVYKLKLKLIKPVALTG